VSAEPDPTFEDALEQLESIVNELERGTPELSDSLAKYEQGVRLLARCQRLLDMAERTVALIAGVDEAGNPVTAPFDATATADREPAAEKRPKRSTRQSRAGSPPPSASDSNDDGIPF
jgi:exodeoxyribonuclease VII small subunit